MSYPVRHIPAEAIRKRAYEIWQREGKPQNKSLEHWQRAETELRDDFALITLYRGQIPIYFWDYHG